MCSSDLDVMLREEAFVRLAPQPRLALETVLVRLIQVPAPATIDALIAKLDTLRCSMAEGPARVAFASPQTLPAESVCVAETSADVPPPVEKRPEPDQAPIQERLLAAIGQHHPQLSGVLPQCRVAQVDQDQIVIEFQGNGFQAGLLQRAQEAIEALCREQLGRALGLVIRTAAGEVTGSRRRAQDRNLIKKEALHHPLVDEAIKLFEGRVVEVRIPEGELP